MKIKKTSPKQKVKDKSEAILDKMIELEEELTRITSDFDIVREDLKSLKGEAKEFVNDKIAQFKSAAGPVIDRIKSDILKSIFDFFKTESLMEVSEVAKSDHKTFMQRLRSGWRFVDYNYETSMSIFQRPCIPRDYKDFIDKYNNFYAKEYAKAHEAEVKAGANQKTKKSKGKQKKIKLRKKK